MNLQQLITKLRNKEAYRLGRMEGHQAGIDDAVEIVKPGVGV